MLVPITVRRNKKRERRRHFQNRTVGSGVHPHNEKHEYKVKDEKPLTEEKLAADIEKVLQSSLKRKILEDASNTNISKCKYIKK